MKDFLIHTAILIAVMIPPGIINTLLQSYLYEH